MEYTSVSNPRWVDAAHTAIAVDIVFPSLGASPLKFTATPTDVMPYGVVIYTDVIAGKYGAIAEHTTS
jgi:hypothetical protein